MPIVFDYYKYKKSGDIENLLTKARNDSRSFNDIKDISGHEIVVKISTSIIIEGGSNFIRRLKNIIGDSKIFLDDDFSNHADEVCKIFKDAS